MTKEFYQILEINENATAEEIKKAYRKLALKWHPDKWSTKSLEERAKANEEMQKINKAYEVLGDEEKKRRYDAGETSFFTAGDSESFEEYVKRMNEQYEAERENIEKKLEILKRIAKILFRSEIEGIISGEALLNEVWEKHFNDMDSNLWAPYNSWVEKVRNIEIGDDENDKEGIDKRELNEFKEKMIKAIKEKGVQLKAEKTAKANSDLERAKLKSIEIIEKELKDKGLKIEDLEEKYHNYKEEINSLTKKFKIRSYENNIMEAIRQKSQGDKFETKQGSFDYQEKSEQLDKEIESSLPPSSDKKIDKEMELIEQEKTQSKKPKKDKSTGSSEQGIIKKKGGGKEQIQDFGSAKTPGSKNQLNTNIIETVRQSSNNWKIETSQGQTWLIHNSAQKADSEIGVLMYNQKQFTDAEWMKIKQAVGINQHQSQQSAQVQQPRYKWSWE